jgi:Amt family ammonium transporter
VALVFFMQGGFAMVETGLTRAKNAGNIIMKNLMDFCLGTVAFWLLGYSLLLGDSVGGFVGALVNPISGFMDLDLPMFMFNLVFCAPAATNRLRRHGGAHQVPLLLRLQRRHHLVIYPIEAHWIWNAGACSTSSASSTSQAPPPSICAAASRPSSAPPFSGRASENTTALPGGRKKVNAIPGHSLTLAALGVFILWFCWYGFNGAAAATPGDAARIFATTTIAAAVAANATMVFTWVKNGKPDVSMTLNGALAGLVAITAGCANVDGLGAALIGLMAGIAVVLAVEFIDQKLMVDDPVGAISVHGCCGALGTILVGFFDTENGLFYGGGAHLLGIQVLGVAAVAAWVVVTMFIVFKLIDAVVGLRVGEQEELEGLDSSEHNLASSYADFVCIGSMPAVSLSAGALSGPVDVESAVPAFVKQSQPGAKLTKVQLFMNQNRFETLKDEMEKIGVTGMTVAHVLGCGTQKGKSKFYRGVEVGMQLLPKIQVDIVVSKVPVADVVAAARRALYTGNIGDGKIFIYDVEDVVRIRTGETGYDALQIQGRITPLQKEPPGFPGRLLRRIVTRREAGTPGRCKSCPGSSR